MLNLVKTIIIILLQERQNNIKKYKNNKGEKYGSRVFNKKIYNKLSKY